MNNKSTILYIALGVMLLFFFSLWQNSTFKSSLLPSGKKAPQFSLPLVNGKKGEYINLESLKGKIVILDFWSYSCPSCITTMEILKKVYLEYNQKEIKIIGINVDNSSPQKVREFAYSLGVEFPLVIDKDLKVAEKYGVSFLPSTFIIDKSGKIRYNHQGIISYDIYKLEIERLLNERE